MAYKKPEMNFWKGSCLFVVAVLIGGYGGTNLTAAKVSALDAKISCVATPTLPNCATLLADAPKVKAAKPHP